MTDPVQATVEHHFAAPALSRAHRIGCLTHVVMMSTSMQVRHHGETAVINKDADLHPAVLVTDSEGYARLKLALPVRAVGPRPAVNAQ